MNQNYYPEQAQHLQGDARAYPSVHMKYQSPNQSHMHPTMRLEQQYKQLQEEKFKKQLQTQSEALLQQQQTFALRQQLNPPVPQFTPQSPTSTTGSIVSHLQKNVPPTTLDLSSHGTWPHQRQQDSQNYHAYHMHPNKQLYESSGAIYGHQTLPQYAKSIKDYQSPQSQVIIQQNHPGLVVNQACQTQMSDPSLKSSSSTPVTPQTPTHQSIERKKSEPTQLKSPVAKRTPTAPITMSGWLYKQGTEGLKVWRKRWFVLSEYCLFYYKGPDESKLLGSILLPSYKISVCTPEDKVYRKYVFKCEHTNMRTYWLGAESRESMLQWMKVLISASLMQNVSESDSQPSSSSVNQSYEGSDSGIHTFAPHSSKTMTPASEFGGQPLYANAPPKPKRLGPDGVCSSPSPDQVQDIYETRRSIIDPRLSLDEKTYDIRPKNKIKESNKRYQQGGFINQEKINDQSSIQYMPQSSINPNASMNATSHVSRRTPDIYSPTKPKKTYMDYDDIYQEGTQRVVHRRPISQLHEKILHEPGKSYQVRFIDNRMFRI